MKLYRIKRNGSEFAHVAGNEGSDKHGWRFTAYTELAGCKAECEMLADERRGMQTFEPTEIRVGGIPDEAVCFFKDGNMWCCVHGDFQNLQESPAGFGENFEEALNNLRLATVTTTQAK